MKKRINKLEQANLNAVVENYSKGYLDFETALNLQKEIHEALA